jgi:hypothetical protein
MPDHGTFVCAAAPPSAPHFRDSSLLLRHLDDPLPCVDPDPVPGLDHFEGFSSIPSTVGIFMAIEAYALTRAFATARVVMLFWSGKALWKEEGWRAFPPCCYFLFRSCHSWVRYLMRSDFGYVVLSIFIVVSSTTMKATGILIPSLVQPQTMTSIRA